LALAKDDKIFNVCSFVPNEPSHTNKLILSFPIQCKSSFIQFLTKLDGHTIIALFISDLPGVGDWQSNVQSNVIPLKKNVSFINIIIYNIINQYYNTINIKIINIYIYIILTL